MPLTSALPSTVRPSPALQVKQRVRSQMPSIQGPWGHEVQAALKRQTPPA